MLQSAPRVLAGDTASYAPNILSAVLFQFTQDGIGFGASYERSLNKKGHWAFYAPITATFNVANSNRIYDYNIGNYSTGKPDAMFYTMPGIKYYPAGNKGKIKYATGASLELGAGKASHSILNLHGLNETEQVQSHLIAGALWQNSLNVNMNTHLYLGAEFGIGGSFTDKLGGISEKNELLTQGSLKVGYRF